MKQIKRWNRWGFVVWLQGLTSLPAVVISVGCAGDTLPLDTPTDKDGQGSDTSSPGDEGDVVKERTLKAVRTTTFTSEADGALGPATIVGDMNGDDYAELVFLDHGGSGPDASTALGVRGAVYLFYGRDRFPATMDAAEADLILRGASESVSGLGDIDGDGYADLAFTTTCLSTLDQCSGTQGVHILYGSAERFSGEMKSDELGLHWTNGDVRAIYSRVSRAGDVNGDGLGDMLFESAPGPEGPMMVHLLFGRRDRSEQAPVPGFSDATFDGGNPDSHLIFGSSGAGDVDDDGYADLLIPANSPAHPGAVVGLFYGSPDRFAGSFSRGDADAIFEWQSIHATLGLGDLDNDGFDDIGLPYHEQTPEALRVIYGRSERFSGSYDASIVDFSLSNPSGRLSGVGFGDIDADGKLDLIVGDATDSAVMFIPGASERRLGHLQTTPEQILASDPPTEDYNPFLGDGAASGGDVNGDGVADIVLTAPGSASGHGYRGRAYLYLSDESE